MITIKKKGFTLVELLVVIAIIALLMSILMPSLNKARKQAKNTVCQSNTKQWGLYFTLYTNEWDGKFQGEWAGGYQDQSWLVTLFDYYKETPKILLCPEGDKVTANSNKTFEAWGLWAGHFPETIVPKGFYDWVAGGQRHGSYGINWFVADIPANAYAYGEDRNNFWRRVDARGGNQTPILLDNVEWIFRPKNTDRPPHPEGVTTGRFGWERSCIDRHNGIVNAVLIDCSIRKIGLKELWKMKWHKNYAPIKPPWPDWMKKFNEYN